MFHHGDAMRHDLALASLLLCAAASGDATAAPATASANASAKATVLKPLTLSAVQDLAFGTVILGNGIWSGATISLSQSGVLSCTNANVTCAGATQVARYKVTGTNRQIVTIQSPNVTLANVADASQQLMLVLDAPASVTMPNSGNQGVEFPIGGQITVNSSTVGGHYSGTLNVTVDY